MVIVDLSVVTRKHPYFMRISSGFFSKFAMGVLLALLASSSISVSASPIAEPKGIADGPGIWVNLWSHPKADQVGSYCLKLHNHGIRNVFIQTSRSNTEAIRNPNGLAKLIESCHHYKIRVIAWSFLMLDNPKADAQKLVDAAQFRTPRGHKFDSVAANIEKDLSPWKVEVLSTELRRKLGKNYPLVAVVFSPLNKAPQVAKTPWKMLDKYYDVIAPMNYWNSKYADFKAYDYTRDTIKKVRELVGRPDAEIHLIGDGMKTHGYEIEQFMRACRDYGVTSASLYPHHYVTDEQYKCLTKYSDYFPVNARFSLAAFRELRAKGLFPHVKDPSSSIPRQEFYKLVTERLVGGGNLSHAQVRSFVQKFKLANHDYSPSQSGVSHREAYDMIARAVELKTRALSIGGNQDLSHLEKLIKVSQNRADKWFVQPVQARSASKRSRDHLNYLEASRLILSSSALLK